MSGIIGFIVWCIFGSFFLVLAVCTWFAKKPMRFWANADVFEVSEIPKYNRAVSKLFGLFGILLIALGTPLLAGQNSAWSLIPVFGTMLASIAAMAVYSLVIEKKYRKH